MTAADVASRTTPRWSIGLAVFVLGVTVYRLSRTIADPDLWGHVVFGERIWAAGNAAQPDLYSYVVPGRLWWNHEWLIDVVFYGLFRAFGPAGLIALKLAVVIAIFAGLYRHFHRRRLSQVVASLLLLVIVIVMTPSLSTVRAQLATFLGFLITLVVLQGATADGGRRLWLLPPVFVVWANFHGGFLAGLGVLIIWATAEIVTLFRGRRHRAPLARALNILVVVAASIGAVCVNPLGFELLHFLRRTALIPRPEIWEWQPLTLATDIGVLYAILVALAGFGLGLGRRRPPLPLLTVLLTAMIMPLFAVRHLALAALAVAVVACETIDEAWDRVRGDRWAKAWTAAPPRSLSAAGFVATAILLALVPSRWSCIELGGDRPLRAAALLKQSGVAANLAVDFDWGTYALATLGPRIKVSVDGRREALYEGQEYVDNLRFVFGTGEWDALLTRYDTHLALVAKSRPVFNLMKLEPGWSLLYEDSLSGLFGKNGLPILETIRRTNPPPVSHDGAGLCFP
jgi:hypothetical protein